MGGLSPSRPLRPVQIHARASAKHQGQGASECQHMHTMSSDMAQRWQDMVKRRLIAAPSTVDFGAQASWGSPAMAAAKRSNR